MKKNTFLLALVAALSLTAPVQAAFIIKQPVATETTTGAPTTIINNTTAQQQDANDAGSNSEKKPKKQHKKGDGLASFIVGLAGIGFGILTLMVLPASLLGAVGLGLLTMLAGIVAIGLASDDKKSLLPQKGFAVLGTIMGIIEALPALAVIFVGVIIYYLCGGRRKSKK